jgi:hypothetical protein
MILMHQNRYGDWWPWKATPLRHYFPIDGLRIEYFDLTASDYDVGDDQIVCPCGAELHRWPDGSDGMGALGAAIQVAQEHLAYVHGKGAAT